MRRLILGICIVFWICYLVGSGAVIFIDWQFQNKLAIWISIGFGLAGVTCWAYTLKEQQPKLAANASTSRECRQSEQEALGVDLFNAAELLQKLTNNAGGVVSHKGERVALPGPSAQTFLALFKLAYIFPQSDFLPKEEANKRLEWLCDVRNWHDWEAHQFNCLAASYGLLALATGYRIAPSNLRKRITFSINRVASEIIANFDDESKGWSWSIKAKPVYPFFTLNAITALQEALPLLVDKNREAAEEAIKKSEVGLKQFLKTNTGDYANKVMAICSLLRISGSEVSVKYEKQLIEAYDGIMSKKRVILETNPRFYIELTLAEITRAFISVSPASTYALAVSDIFFKWAKENQHEGWGWHQVPEDASWSTAQVLLTFAVIHENPKLTGALI